VVTLQNGLGNEEALARLVGAERILGGLCFVCLNRVAPGVVHHLAHGRVVLGEFRRPAGPRARQLAEWLRNSEIPCELTDQLARAHWEKLAWNIPFNGLGVAGAAGYQAVATGIVPPDAGLGDCLPTDVLLGDPRWETLALGLMQEVIRVANALGYEAPATWADEQIARTRCMGAYWASTLIDFARGAPLELESLFLEPLRQARAAGVDTPLLERLCAVLTALDRRQRLSERPGVA
jgi:2-dehydropantoate 2-reductase